MTRASRRFRSSTLLAALALASVSWACASTGAAPRPFPTPGAPAPPSGAAEGSASPISEAGSGLAGTALELRGRPYRTGGADPHGFDCSGFTQYVFGLHGIALPRDVRDQFRVGTRVKADDVIPGDLLFFSTVARGASHVGIAIGGGQFVHAPSSKGVVRVEPLGASYWSRRFVGARRVNAISTAEH